MRHGKKFNHLGRKVGHRRAVLRSLASSLILNKRIVTTVAKAKELRKYVEPLITKAKNPTTSSRRVVFSYLQKKEAVHELFTEISGKVADRNGGYTRIVKMGTRLGDSAEMAMIELVDYNTLYSQSKESTTKKKTRRRRGGKSSAAAENTSQVTPEVQEAVVEDAVADEVETVVEESTPVEDTAVVEEVAEPTTEEVSEDAPEPEVETPSAEAETEGEDTSEEASSDDENSEEKKD